MKDLGLKDKVAVVTGASRGIGRAVAECLAGEGMRLICNFQKDAEAMRRVEEECKKRGAEVAVVQADIQAPQSAAAVRDVALTRFGRVDVLVNNAGIAHDNLLVALSEAQIQAMVATNILGVVNLSRALLRPMLKQGSGCIINISSTLASRPGRGNSVYAGTKGFIESFTRALAVEVGQRAIRVNAVAPGVIETDMSAKVRSMAGALITERIGLRRFGSPEEVASLVAFLASDHAAYINGAVVPIDGAFMGG
jgi:3-oxoacyl-[acyl-carrier protein] reductase